MTIEQMHLGMKVRHPQYGEGQVKALAGQLADIEFNDGVRQVSPELSGLQPAEARAELSGLTLPLTQLLAETVRRTVEELGCENPDATVQGLGSRWNGGRLVLHPGDEKTQSKEVPLEIFFHKIVMMRNNLRCLEQKINGHPQLNDGDKVELQQYITRCYGSMTTFNVLFRRKEDQFIGSTGS